MAAVRDTAEEACALRRAEGTLGLYNAEDGFFHVLSPKRLALVSSSLERSGGGVPLPTKDQGEAFRIDIRVRRGRLLVALEEGRCCVDRVEVAKGGTPTELKLGSTLEVGGSRFTLATQAAVSSSSRPKVGQRKGRSLPTPPTGSIPKEHAAGHSHNEADPGNLALDGHVNSDVLRLQNTPVSSGPRKLPRGQPSEPTRSGRTIKDCNPNLSANRRVLPTSGHALSPQTRKLPLPPTQRGSKHGPVAMTASPVPPRSRSECSNSDSSREQRRLSLVAGPSGSTQAPAGTGSSGGKSHSSSLNSLTTSGVGVRGLMAQELPGLDINSLLGQHKGVGAGLPTISRSSPYYYPTLSLRRSGPEHAELREMLAHSSSSSSEEEGDSPDVAPPPYSVRQGGDGSDVQSSENVCLPQMTDPAPTGSASPKPKRTSWDPVLPSDELFPFRQQRSAVLSVDQQAVEEVQAGHWDVICTLRAREQLIPNVCRLWSEDKALQAVTNTLQMCLTENEEDVALLLGVLDVFMDIPGPWRLSVCAVLLPTLQKLVLGHLDKTHVLAACRVVEMMLDRFSTLILTCKRSPLGPKATLAATSDHESKEMCFSELSKMAAVVAQQLSRQQEPVLRAALERLRTKLDPFSNV